MDSRVGFGGGGVREGVKVGDWDEGMRRGGKIITLMGM